MNTKRYKVDFTGHVEVDSSSKLLNDKDILELCRTKQMIEPYQITKVRGYNGIKALSYGLSSFGYDISLSDKADEFKVFSSDPFNSSYSLIDPKNFNLNTDLLQNIELREDNTGTYYILKGHSYALGVTREYFKIPNNIFGIVLTKSTLARCFTGNTKIALANNSSITFEEMACNPNLDYFGYGINEIGEIELARLVNSRYIGNEHVLEITLDNGEKIYCTGDHEFFLRGYLICKASDLEPGDSLFPLYRKNHRGYESFYQPIIGQSRYTYLLADKWNINHGIYNDNPQTVRHHKDLNKLNNYPDNIERLTSLEHHQLHNSDPDGYYGESYSAENHGQKVKDALDELKKDVEWVKKYSESQRSNALKFWGSSNTDPQSLTLRNKLIENLINYSKSEQGRENMSKRMVEFFSIEENRKIVSERSKKYWERASQDRRVQQQNIMRALNLREDITEDSVRKALAMTGTKRGAARLLNCDRTVFKRFSNVIKEFEDLNAVNNHKIISIKEVKGSQDVYCLTSELGNFALDSGVFVKNCGCLVNCTPVEPGWNGNLVVEIANLTSIAMKVYVNEGIAQMYFFESNQHTTPYDGHYQNQIGLTLAKV